MRPALWVRRRWQQPSGILGVNQLKITAWSGNSLPSPSFSDSRMALSCNGQCSQYGQWSTIKNSRSQTIKNHWFWELLTKPPLIKGCLCQWSRTVSWNKASNRSSSMGVFDLQVAIDRLCKKFASSGPSQFVEFSNITVWPTHAFASDDLLRAVYWVI